jgi:putative two-component system response regulator
MTKHGPESDPRILVVDDEERMREMLVRVLEHSGYRCSVASDAQEARKLLEEQDFSLVLTDMEMPGGSSLDLITDLSKTRPDVATVMITGLDDTGVANSALEVGAYGYIIKPFEPSEVVIGIANALRRRELERESREHRRRLESTVHKRTSDLWNAITRLEAAEVELRLSRAETIQRLSVAAEYRDSETGRHIERMSGYCALLFLMVEDDASRAEEVRMASKMHDVGKIGIPDEILFKAGTFSAEERKSMQRHTEIGHRILSGSRSQLLDMAAEIAYSHHERVDGTGYPRGLNGEDIPLLGRIATIADVFDALSTDRVYRKAFPLDEAVRIMKEGRGTQFDKELLDLFLGSLDSIIAAGRLDPHSM